MKKNSRKTNVLLNISIGYISQIGILILTLIGRKIFLSYLSVEYLGVNGLYSNILTVLSLAELGVDTALVYSLYKPVAENNIPLISSLLIYFKKIYTRLALFIFLLGVCLVPLLKYIINSNLTDSELIIYYLLFLINTVATYFVAHKSALLLAFQEQRIQKFALLLSNLILQVIYIIVLVIFANYYLYLVATVITTLCTNVILGWLCDRYHFDIKQNKINVSFDKNPIKQRIKSTLLYKIGSVAVSNTDNILISTIVNTNAVGLYYNYFSIISSIQSFLAIITSSLISGVGNLSVAGDKEKQYNLFNVLLICYHFVAAVGLIGLHLLFNDVITLWIGEQYLFGENTVLAISFNFYLSTIVTPIWMYREANGLFEQVRFLMLIRAVINIMLSIILGVYMGTTGILLATAISLIVSNFWYEPIVLFKAIFNKSVYSYWKKQIKYSVLTLLSYFICNNLECFMFTGNTPLGIVVQSIIIIIVVSLMFVIFNINTTEFKTLIGALNRKYNMN